MSWGYGVIRLPDGTEMEVGYSVDAVCEHPGCDEEIDRGISYRCGGANFEAGCGHYFCGWHLFDSSVASRARGFQLCEPCAAKSPQPCEECDGTGEVLVANYLGGNGVKPGLPGTFHLEPCSECAQSRRHFRHDCWCGSTHDDATHICRCKSDQCGWVHRGMPA